MSMQRVLKAAIIFSAIVFPHSLLQAQIAVGDGHYARRAEGSTGGRAAAGPIDAAIAAYERAVRERPDSLEARAKLLRSIRFKSAYVLDSTGPRRELLQSAREIGDASLAVVARQLAPKRIDLRKASEKEIANALRGTPYAAELFQWDAVVWGEWALVYGKLAAARQGAADRIRRSATISMLIDPRAEEGGAARVLGRLHHQTPRIPFVTGWASNREAVRFLEQAVEIDPTNAVSRLFLAEALVDADSAAKPRAVAILKTLIGEPVPDREWKVEFAAAIEDAREVLRGWGEL